MTRLERVWVVGTSGSGKTTFARQLAAGLGSAHVELDALHWGPDWAAAPAEELRAKVAGALTAKAWVVDGNYQGKLGSFVLDRADTWSGSTPPGSA